MNDPRIAISANTLVYCVYCVSHKHSLVSVQQTLQMVLGSAVLSLVIRKTKKAVSPFLETGKVSFVSCRNESSEN